MKAGKASKKTKSAARDTNKYADKAPPRREPPKLVRMHEDKVRWNTLAEAAAARDSAAAAYGEDFAAYYCPVCHGYHTGHRRTW